jgi:hypothetical protein
MQLAKSEVTLEGHSEEVVPFTVDVPAGADVGEHNGCIAIQDVRKNEAGGNGIVLSFRSALRVAVMVPGQIRASLSIKEFNVTTLKDKIQASPLLRNSGNVSIDSKLDVFIKNIFGGEIETGGGKFPILRDTESRFNVELKSPFWGGWYNVGGSVAYNPLQTTKQAANLSEPQTLPTRTLFIMPDPRALAIEIGVVAFIVAGIAFAVWRAIHARMMHRRSYEHEVIEGDDIETLAQQNHTTWKTIAKLNHLKPPYHLLPGAKIKIPGKRKPSHSKPKKSPKE